ncbi:MAG: DUF2577 domain-containing protein [Oscillospiraceae bacterium]|nr:DUF2577 domain-containing protein [Oscillospiraceae bacterium]
MTGILKLIKSAALDAMAASKPVELCFGKVLSEKPLKILVEQKLTLGEQQLTLTRNVTDYKTKISGGNIQNYFYAGTAPDITAEPVSPQHVHAVGTIEITVHNALKKDETVVLLRQQGGQKYLVVDRV